MKDKEKIYLQACLYAITKLVGKGSFRYSYKDNDGKWNSISWDEVMDWILEKRGAESETTTLNEIRAEIEQNAYPIVHGVNNHEKGMTLYGILQIIDKYKAESEVGNE